METAVLQSGDYKPASGQKIKARAPPPPNQPPVTSNVNNEHKVTPALEMLPDQSMLNMKENLINNTVDFMVVFPDGEEQKNTVHGSKAVMDLLVDLCSQYHLNPAHYTLELQSWGTQQPLSYKPNTLIGALDVQKILLKVKVPEEKTKRPPPKIPEKTVRLVVNYLKTQKTVVRVNPEVPLQSIIPVICEKCEVSQECLVLLRDTFTGEKLELTKSLNELGIKELYAWNKKKALPSKTQSEPSLNYRETRNTSTGCDTSEKEKKRFLGFFKTSKKNSKAEESSRTSLDWDGGEPLKSITSSKQSLDGAVATSDSSGNLCSVMVAPSLSLGNISGITGSTEIKKRRAPPLPVIPPFPGGEADGEEKMPSPMSQSSLQHELKKKKRRAPPPPTPAMPNRSEEMEDKRQSTIGNVQLSHIYNEDNVEETISFSSCSMSEDNIDDSEVINLPSDIVSLDFENAGINSRDKSIDVEETLAAEVCSVKNASFNSDESENIQQRADGRMMEAKFENTDMFMVAHEKKAQPALDKSLAVMENIHTDSKSQLVLIETNDTSSSLPQNAETPCDVSFPVPVTIIDEVPENYTTTHSSTEEENVFFSKMETSENIPVQSTYVGKLINKSNNIESVSKEYVGTSSYLPKNLSQKSSTEEFLDQTEEQRSETAVYTFSNGKQNKKNTVQKSVSKNCIDSEKPNAQGIAYNFKLLNKVNGVPDKARPLNENDINDELNKSELEFKHALAKNPDERESDPTQSPWHHCINNGIEIYGPKTGLTTFKVVPPKPEVKYFDRDVSLYTGAIRIDELGNLVTPNSGGIRKITVNMTSKEAVIGKAKEYKELNSIEKQCEQLLVGHSVEPEITGNSKELNKNSRTKPDCIRSLKAETLPVVGSSAENIVGANETKLPMNIPQFSGKTVLAPVINRKDLLFQMPPQKTSDHYLATAVANCNDLTQFKASQERQNQEKLYKAKGVKTEIEPLPRSTVVAKYRPVETEPAKTKKPYSTTFSCSKTVSNTRPCCADSRLSNIKTLNQNKPTNGISGSFTRITSNKNNLTEQEINCGSVQDITDREMISVAMKKPVGQVSSPFFLSKPNADSSATIFSSPVKSSNMPPFMVDQMTSEKDEQLGSAGNELCSSIIEDNIYNIFGPKKKFKSVIQKPLPKDTSLHSALMEAIQTAGGRDKLRKISHSTINGTQKELKFMETETEHSALLAAIRGHSGISTLRKISSSASDELQRFRNAEVASQNVSISTDEQQHGPPPPPLPLPPTQLGMETPRSLARMTDSPGNSRQALMEAIRSGAGTARLRKVPLFV
ncbi:protein cordon-bleu isoform 3-T3 [Liasis olivaceus]